MESPFERLTRRDFIRLSAIATVPLLAACAPAPPAAPTAAPKAAAPAPTSPPAAPTAAPAAPTAPPAAPTAAAAATATTAPAPTAAAPAATAAPTQPAVAIKRGGTAIDSYGWTYPTFDSHLSTAGAVGYEALYNRLVRLELVDPKTWEHRVVGDLAESWEQPDPKTILMKLKQGVTFHDGSPFTAEVAAWNLLRARDHPKSQLKDTIGDLESVETPDKSTLKLKLKVANPAFLRLLAYHGYAPDMLSKAAMEKLGEDGFGRAPVGTGPFRFKQWIADDRLITERNPDYFEKGADGKPLPYLDGMVHRNIPDPSVALVDMRAGKVHVLEGVSTKDVATVKADSNLVAYSLPWAGQTYFMVGFNAKAPPFNDVRIRQAAVQGIDRAAMAKTLGFGIGAPHYYTYWTSGTLGWDESLPKNEYNPAKVKELLAAAGFPNGISIELKVIAREPENTIGEFVQQMWTAVGIKTKLISLERLAWINAMRAMNFQAGFWRGSFAPTVDPDLLKLEIICGAAGNWAQFCDPDIDRLMNEGTATVDPKKRQEIYRDVNRLIQERAYIGTGVAIPLTIAYRKEVEGLRFNFDTPDYRKAWLK